MVLFDKINKELKVVYNAIKVSVIALEVLKDLD